MKPICVALVLCASLAFAQGTHVNSPASSSMASSQDPGPIGTLAGIEWMKKTLDLTIIEPKGGTIKSWFILAPPRAMCTIKVDGTIRYSGRFGNLFMSRASMPACFTDRAT